MQLYLRAIWESGGAVSMAIVLGGVKGISLKMSWTLLAEYGGLLCFTSGVNDLRRVTLGTCIGLFIHEAGKYLKTQAVPVMQNCSRSLLCASGTIMDESNST